MAASAEAGARLEDIDVSSYGFPQDHFAVIMPVSVMPREAVYSVYLEAQKRAVQAGIAYLRHVAPQRLVVRQLRPADVGLAGPDWSFEVAAGATRHSFAVPRDRALTFFGVYNQSERPKVYELEVLVNGRRRLLLNLQELYTRGYDPIGVLPVVEVFRPGDEVALVMWSVGQGREELALLGYVAEPEGATVYRS